MRCDSKATVDSTMVHDERVAEKRHADHEIRTAAYHFPVAPFLTNVPPAACGRRKGMSESPLRVHYDTF